ncbi:MAG: Lrp/AsnC family transcriptional regulator [Betaproteobacteria bacterium]|nr:Lrp/AsnC family transcriptional regulator [Betaproteobacteria bacterium]MCC6250336.1 Lrp/AsnC family transcriptional regulator [Rubrivivax sp.]MCL4695656.1 Lrp/AsnC family transcriptional regulator [Burkholderiaceae bacterium]
MSEKNSLNGLDTPLDRYSLAILAELLRDARQTIQQIADKVGLSASPCWKRIKDMEAAGVIRGYTAIVDTEKVGLGLRVIVEANMAQHSETTVRQFERAVAAAAPIVQCHATTGESDYVMSVLVPDIKRYEQLLHDTMFKLPGITHVRSAIVLKEIKSEMRLALPEGSLTSARRGRRGRV